MSYDDIQENQNTYLEQHSRLLLMLGRGVGYLLHIHLEQGLGPFHLKEEKRSKIRLLRVSGKIGRHTQDEHACLSDKACTWAQSDLLISILIPGKNPRTPEIYPDFEYEKEEMHPTV